MTGGQGLRMKGGQGPRMKGEQDLHLVGGQDPLTASVRGLRITEKDLMTEERDPLAGTRGLEVGMTRFCQS